MVPRRLERLDSVALPDHARVYVARSLRARLLGLGLLPELPSRCGLLIPGCRSVHTAGMRFALDVIFLDAEGRVLGVEWEVGPGRVVWRRGAAAVLEVRAGQGGRFLRQNALSMERTGGSKLRAALDPRQPIYRDRYNEYFVFLLSAAGASVVVPVLLLVVNALTDKFAVGVFLAASAALELLLIFGVGRPQMKPLERVGWALLWGTAAVLLGASFYYLVVDPVL
jgi:uncharacterized protein